MPDIHIDILRHKYNTCFGQIWSKTGDLLNNDESTICTMSVSNNWPLTTRTQYQQIINTD